MKIKTFCKCGKESRSGQRTCLDCHAAYARNWRKSNKLSESQRFKMNCRSYANTYQRRGLLKKEPCEICGDKNTEKHHHDYSKPLEVNWLCKDCHKIIGNPIFK